MKELAEIKDECSFYEDKFRQFDQMKIQVLRLQNEPRDSKRQITNLQAELHVRSENDNHAIIESGRRQCQVEQPNENLQVNPQYDRTYGQNNNEFLPQNTHSIHSVDYNHGQSYTSRVNGIGNTNMVPRRSFSSYNTGTSGQSNNRNSDGPKFRLPYYNGKNDFVSFWTIFKIGVKKFNWNEEKQIEQLLCSLKDDALTFATKLPVSAQNDINAIYAALNQRYGDHLLPEQYREDLNQVRKLPKESLNEYASRVGDLVTKSFPDLALKSPELITTLTIENLLKGIPDQTLSYEVRTKSPKTLDEAIRLLTWHECCKNGSKRQVNVRHVEETDLGGSDADVRKVISNSDRKYVTEDKLAEINKQLVQDMTGEFKKLIASNLQSGNRGNRDRPTRNLGKFSDVTCYSCQGKGHISKFCPEKGNHTGTRNSQSSKNGTSDRNNISQGTNATHTHSLN